MHEAAPVNPWVALAYLISGVCFILALRGLSSPASSRRGNRYGMIGMALAVGTTLFTHEIASLPEILVAIAIGAVIGVAIIVFDQILKNRNAPFRVPVLAAAIGIYLPLETMVPIFLGGLLNYLVTRSFGSGLTEEEKEKRNQTGTLFAAGLITGEALMGIAIGAAIYKTDNPEVFALPASLQLGGSLGEWVGLVILGAIGFWMYKVGKRQPAR